MRVLWFTNSPSNYLHGTNTHNGGGWISSLEDEFKKRKDIDLAIAFLINDQPFKVCREGICYYPIRHPFDAALKGKIRRLMTSSQNQQNYFIKEYIRVIDDFNPDIINIFGSEQNFGMIVSHIDIPIVIHIQGLLNPCLTSYFPPGYNEKDYYWANYNLWAACNRYFFYKSFQKKAYVEELILKHNSHFIGRTEWDQSIVKIYNPDATYDYCSEILRRDFYLPNKRVLPEKLTIISTLSSPLYKGFDMVLKCAKILKFLMNIDFEWKVFGDINPSLQERKENVAHSDVNIHLMGVANQTELVRSLCSCTLYVHPSYIDNSPNSVCESQMLGCTVIGQNVGGMPSLVKNGETGILVPANDPYQMAYAIRDLYVNPTLNIRMGEKASEVAQKRHNKDQILNDLLAIYQKYMKSIRT